MHIDTSIFKAYDIRGIYPEQINPEFAYNFGFALASFLKSKKIAVGRDMRTSSEELSDNLIRGMIDFGSDVYDLGLISTDGLYFAVGKYEYDAGVMITASHNPKEYNGFKVCKKNAVPLSGQDGLNNIKEMMQKNHMIESKGPERGNIIRKNVLEDYAEHCLSFVDINKLKKFKIVIDAGNGMAGATLPVVLNKLPIDVDKLFFELDGTFPNHPASPIELENLQDLITRIKEINADFGVAFDGDADRMFLVDKQGNQVGGDMVTAMVAKSLLSKNSDETILYNLICSKAVPELVFKMGGQPVRTRVGHALIKPLMKKHNAVFGGEHSGHFYFRENWFADSGLIAFLVCLELLSEEGRPLEDLIKELDPYFRSGEINSKVENISAKIDEVKSQFQSGQIDEEDGLTVQYDNFWFNLRPSNTEPLLRLNIEADSKEILEQKKTELLNIIRG